MTILNADKWIFDTLSKDAVIAAAVSTRIYQDEAPAGTVYPLMVMGFVSSVPVENVCADKVMDEEIWRVKVIDDGATYANLEGLADQVRSILHKASGTGVIGCRYSGCFRFAESRDGRECRTVVLEFEVYTE
jgi:hypothetical protein